MISSSNPNGRGLDPSLAEHHGCDRTDLYADKLAWPQVVWREATLDLAANCQRYAAALVGPRHMR